MRKEAYFGGQNRLAAMRPTAARCRSRPKARTHTAFLHPLQTSIIMVTICDLPDELVLRALASLPLEDLCRLQRVCRRLQSLAVADGLWEALHQRTYAERDGGSSGAGASSPAAAGAAAAAAVSPSRQAQRGLADTFAAVAVGASASSVASAIAALPSVKRGGEKCRELTLHAAKAQESPAAVTWRERFKARFIEQSRQQRLVRRARHLKAEGTVQVLAQEAHRLQAALAREQREVPLLQAQLAAVQQTRQANRACGGCLMTPPSYMASFVA